MTHKEILKRFGIPCKKTMKKDKVRCPFRSISNDYCEEYEAIKKDLDRLEKENKELKRLNKNLRNSNTHKDTYASKLKEENEKLKKIIRDYCQIIDTNYGGVIRMYVEENEESNEKDFKLLKEVLEDD